MCSLRERDRDKVKERQEKSGRRYEGRDGPREEEEAGGGAPRVDTDNREVSTLGNTSGKVQLHLTQY